MTITDYLTGIKNCRCGRTHDCPIEHIIIGEGAFDALPAITEPYKSILLVADNNTYAVCGEEVEKKLGERISVKLIYKRNGVLVPNEEAISEMDACTGGTTDLIVGIGSGVINDLCKIVSFNHSIPYYIVATAPSMDGYASKGSALILNGMKVTLNAAVPRAIIADTRVLAQAPFEMIQAGYGDIIGKFSCLNDWKLSALVNGEYICERVVAETYDEVKKTVALSDGITARDPHAVGALMEALVAVGILMAYVGNSRPASGSEHHLSHYFEIIGIERGEQYLPHGIDVCFSAVETCRLREKLLEIKDIDTFEYRFDKKKYEREIKRIYGTVAEEVLALQEKTGWYGVDRVGIYREKWDEITALLGECPTGDEMLSLCSAVGLDHSKFKALYGDKKISDALLYAKDLKDRFSILWVYFDLFA